MQRERNSRATPGLPEAELRAPAAHFDDATLKQVSGRYPKFTVYRKDRLH